MSYIPRIIEKNILDAIKQEKPPFNTILLGGARQCGKSTLLEHLFPPQVHLHINLALESGFCEAIDATESFADFALLLENRFGLKAGGEKVLIFDEAQLSKKLGDYVRFFKEKWQTQRVILTGSTLSTLFENAQKPTGRVSEFVLRPFNFSEFLTAMGKETLLEKIQHFHPREPLSQTAHHEMIFLLQEYLKIGGLPEVVLAYKEKRDFLRLVADIFAFYKRDFQQKLTSENLTGIFNQVFLRIAAATGSPIKLSSIIKSSSPGYKKVADVLSILESWHQILRVDWEASKLSKVGTMTPKRYIFDHGIRFLQNPARFGDLDLLDTASLKREEVGGLIENFVLTELLSLGSPLPIRSWAKTHQSGFVDFLYQDGRHLFAMEVKAAVKLDQKHLSALLACRQFYPEARLILANLGPGGLYQTGGIEISVVPVYCLYPFLRNFVRLEPVSN